MRARLAMYYSKINYEHREISLKNRPRELYNISSKGTVPVLELQSGKVIDESFEIMKWAISLNDPKKWFHNSKEKQSEAVLVNDSHFKKWLDKYKYHVRYPDNEKSFYRSECEKILDDYEKIKSLEGWGNLSVSNLKYSILLKSFLALSKTFIWLAQDVQYFTQELTTTILPSD